MDFKNIYIKINMASHRNKNYFILIKNIENYHKAIF